MELVFFRSHADYLAGLLPVGRRRILSGRIERFKDRLQMAHPDAGGSLDQAQAINAARDLIAARMGWA